MSTKRFLGLARRGLPNWVLCIVAGSLPIACGDGAQTPPPPDPGITTAWTIGVRITDDQGNVTAVALNPADSDETRVAPWSTGPAAQMNRLKRKQAPPATTKDVTIGGAPSDAGTDSGKDVPIGSSNGYLLLWAAAAECGMGVNPQAPGLTAIPGHWKASQTPVAHPWNGSSYYIFPHSPASCDEQLEDEEVLVCVADKLQQVADSPSALVWSHTGAVTPPAGLGITKGTWTIPPQPTGTRFIARDMALNVLAHVARLDMEAPAAPANSPFVGASCAKMYSAVATPAPVRPGGGPNSPPGSTGNSSAPPASDPLASLYPVLFAVQQGTSGFYPTTDTANPSLAANRLEFEAHILRAASRTLASLVSTSQADDLAMAQLIRTQTAESVGGGIAAWSGASDGTTLTYNSLTHAVRTVAGRLEMPFDLPVDPPLAAKQACHRQDPLATVAAGIKTSAQLAARQLDAPIQTPSQLAAVTAVESSGVVYDTTTLAGIALSDLQAAVIDQILQVKAKASGTTVSTLGPLADAIKAQISAIAEGDLRFALVRNAITYAILTNQPVDQPFVFLNESGPTAGVTLADPVSPLIVGGSAIGGGLSHGRIHQDPMGQIAGALSAGQCPEVDSAQATMSLDSPYNDRSYQPNVPSFDRYVKATFQNAAAVGDTYGRRLRMMSEVAKAVPSLGTIARGALAENRAQISGGRITVEPLINTAAGTTTGTPASSVVLHLRGYSLSQLGMASATDVPQIKIVAGPTWVADCASGARVDCPADLSNYVTTAPSAVTDASGTSTALTDGAAYSSIDVTMPLPAFAAVGGGPGSIILPGSNHSSSGVGIPSPSATPSGPTGGGRVAGTFSTSGISTLVDPATKYGETIGSLMLPPPARPITLESSSLSDTKFYCNGVSADIFVPLENEITSDSDPYENSWRHYLTIAQQSAANADALGQQLIQQGTNIDLRREAAGEAVSNICGVTTDLTSVKFGDNGEIVSPAADAALGVCVGETPVDLVFFSTNTYGALVDQVKAGTATLAELKVFRDQLLGCSTSQGASEELCKKDLLSITSDALGLSPKGTPTANGGPSCSKLAAVGDSLETGFDGLAWSQALSDAQYTDDSMRGNLAALRMNIQDSGDFQVTLGGTILMSTVSTPDGSLWPGCLNTAIKGPTAAPCDYSKFPIMTVYDKVFNPCPPGSACGTSLDTTPTINTIRIRVHASLWELASFAGNAPEGLITMPVPVATTRHYPAFVYYPYDDFESYGSDSGGSLYRWAEHVAPGAPRAPTVTELDVMRGAHAFNPLMYRVLPEVQANELHDLLANVGRPIFDPSIGYYDGGWFQIIARNSSVTMGAGAAGADALQSLGWKYPIACARVPAAVSTPSTYLNPFDEAVPVDAAWRASGPTPGQIYWGLPLHRGDGTSPLAPRGGLFPYLPAGSSKYCGSDRRACGFDAAYLLEVGAANAQYAGAALDPLTLVTPVLPDLVGGAPVQVFAADFNALAPDQLKPADRVRFFANSAAPLGACVELRSMIGAVTLNCSADAAPGAAPAFVPTPPTVASVDDLSLLEGWFASLDAQAKRQVQSMFSRRLSPRVVADFKDATVASGATAGSRGDKLLDLEAQIQSAYTSLAQISSDVSQLHTALRSARLRIEGADLAHEATAAQLAISEFQTYASMATTIASAISGLSIDPVHDSAAGLAAEGSVLAVEFDTKIIDAVQNLKKFAASQNANQIAQALSDLQTSTQSTWTNISTSLASLRSAGALMQQDANDAATLQAQAQYEAAKGAGLPYFVDSTGNTVSFPVNLVNGRQYNVTAQRYRAALAQAKYDAFLARRAVEQRLGVPLNTLTSDIGAVGKPSDWADRLCGMTGIDYTKLTDVSLTPAPDSAFGNQYIGDYVNLLQQFVEAYNVAYPTHEGDDTMILSLRDDLLPRTGRCLAPSTNLLLESGHLERHIASATRVEDAGWRSGWCGDATACLAVYDQSALPVVTADPSQVSQHHASWLVDQVGLIAGSPASGSFPDAGSSGVAAASAGLPDDLRGSGVPARNVFQAVSLTSSTTYTLSWFDQARDTNGQPLATPSVPYRIALYKPAADPSTPWQLVEEAWNGIPQAVTDPTIAAGSWSPQRTHTFNVPSTGTYYLGISASSATDPSVIGSVVIADVQLADANGYAPLAYVANDTQRTTLSSTCPLSNGSALRKAFTPVTDPSGAVIAWDLSIPIIIDTAAFNGKKAVSVGADGATTSVASSPGALPLYGKLAGQNTNYRSVQLAVNLVGTGVKNCSGSDAASCYSAGYVQYSLEHNANQVPIVTWQDTAYTFDFGVGHINQAKGLAAERYFTIPISSADNGLLQTVGFERSEFRGRPLDGTYKLRVWNDPSLVWQNLDDIQVIWQYHYWAPIDRTGTLPTPSSN
jgi:hypothetical protein